MAKQDIHSRPLITPHYLDIIVRLANDGSGAIEVSAHPSDILIDDEVIPLPDIEPYIRLNDITAEEDVGFLFSERFGLMVDLEHEENVWVTALTRDRLKRLRKLA